MKVSFLFVILSLLHILAYAFASNSSNANLKHPVHSISDCGDNCRFALCDANIDGERVQLPKEAGLIFPPAFEAQLPFICSSAQPRLGRILRAREARVRLNSGRFIRIARLGRLSLKAQFNPRFFQITDLNVPEIIGVSAITRSKFRSMDQRKALEGRCTVIPINTWEIRRPNGITGRIVTNPGPNSCVGFVSTGMTTMIKVTFHWDTAGDFDLTLKEPDGNVINDAEPVSSTGGFLFQDVELGDCSVNRGVRRVFEMIEYTGVSKPLPGRYTVEIIQFAVCSVRQKVNWDLCVQVGDETVLSTGGVIDGTTETLGPFTFIYP